MLASHSVLIALIACGVAGPPAETPWEDILRDAQIANMSTIEGGKFHFRIEAEMEGWKAPVRLEGEYAWNGESTFAEFQFEDPGGMLFGVASDDLKRYPPGILMRAGSSDYAFSPANRTLFVRDLARSSVPALLELHPDSMWFRCCPPHFKGEGRPWPEMVGPLPAAKTGGVSGTVEFTEPGPDLVRQTRRDPNGYVVEIDFSLRDCGMPVRMRSTAAPDAPLRTSRGEFRWKHLGKSCVIESIEVHEFAPGKPDHEIESFKLEVRDVVLKPEPSRFTEQAMLQRISGGFSVQDRRTDPKRKRIAPRVSEADDADLGKDLLDRGFLKKGKK